MVPRTVLCAALIALVLAFTPALPASAADLYGFDTGAQGFTVNQRGEIFPYGDPHLTWTPDRDVMDSSDSGALQLDLDLQGDPPDLFDATIIQSPEYGMPGQQTWDLSGFTHLNVMIYVPEAGPSGLEAVIFTKSGDGWSWSQGPWTPLTPGTWNRVSIETGWIAEPSQVEAMGVKIGGNLSGGGTVFVDRFYASNPFEGLSFDFNYNYRIVTATGYTGTPVAPYSADAGYGYQNLCRVYSGQRIIEDPLRLDFHYSFWDGEFAVDLENGAYEVTIHYGDIYNALDRMQVFAEGALKADNLSSDAMAYQAVTFEVEVTDGQLNLVFHDDGGSTPYWLINGIEIDAPEVDTEPPITTADLPAGTYLGGQEVCLTSNEPATIYYTTDGSTPSENAPIYVQPIPLAGDATIRFFGVDTAGNVEAPAHAVEYSVTLPGNEQRFDFDASTQTHTAVGYTPVPVAAYTPSTGFGYKQVFRIYTVRRTYGNALLRDSHYSFVDSEFMIDLENGPYTVTLHVGDRFQATDQVDVYAEGDRVISNLSTPEGTFRAESFDVDITDGQLNLVFHNGGGQSPYWLINGLDLVYTGDDTTPPVSEAIPAGGEYPQSQSVVLTADEAADIFYTTDGSEPNAQSAVYDTPIEIAEDTTLRFLARDLAGNVETPAHTETYTILPPEPYTFSVEASPSTVGAYEKLEVSLSWDHATDYENPFDPQEVLLAGVFTAPSGRRWRVPGFWDGSGWCIRFVPDETGEWRVKAEVEDANGMNTSDAVPFICVSSEHHGPITLSSEDPFYFLHQDGTPFWGIGHNRCWSLEQLGWTPQDGYTLLTDMADAGMNLLGFWMAPWDTQLVTLSTGYDRYDMNRALELDAIIEDAERKGIKLLLAVWAHDALRDIGHPWGNGQWQDNPFKDLSSCDAFLTDAASWTYQKNLYRYIMARWGYSRAIGLWHTICEIEGIGTTSAITSAKNLWHDKVTQYFRDNDPFEHPVTGSNTHHSGLWTAGYAAMDSPQIHVYEATGDPIHIASRIAHWVSSLRGSQSKPAMIGEFGTSNQALQPEHIHNGAWAGLASGGAVSPLDWNDGGAWGDMTPAMFDTMAVLSAFAADLPLGASPLEPAAPDVAGCNAWGMQEDDFAFGWILSPSGGTVTGETLTLSGLNDGDYTVAWWNTWTGDVQTAQATCSGGSLVVPVPDFSKDIAFKVLPP